MGFINEYSIKEPENCVISIIERLENEQLNNLLHTQSKIPKSLDKTTALRVNIDKLDEEISEKAKRDKKIKEKDAKIRALRVSNNSISNKIKLEK